METCDIIMASHFADLLEQRAAILRHALQDDVEVASAGDPHDVSDFKDTAGERSQAVVDEALAANALRELSQTSAALQRLLDHRYGRCLECGHPVDLPRLLVLPATPLCRTCQDQQEQLVS